MILPVWIGAGFISGANVTTGARAPGFLPLSFRDGFALRGAHPPGVPPLSFRDGFNVTTGARSPGIPPLSFRAGFKERPGYCPPGFPPYCFMDGFTEDDYRYYMQFPRHNVLLRM